MINCFDIENCTPDPADAPEIEALPFGVCVYCGEPIEFEEIDVTLSEYMETDAGLMHSDCAKEYFTELVDQNTQTAHIRGNE